MAYFFYLCFTSNPKDCLIYECIGVDLGAQPGHAPPIIEKRLCIHKLLTPLPPIFFPQYFLQIYATV